MIEISQKLSIRMEEILESSRKLAWQSGKKEVETSDLFLALLAMKGSLAREVLSRSGLEEKKVFSNFLADNNSKKIEQIDFSSAVKKVIQKSVKTAVDKNQAYVGTEHLLYAVLKEDSQEINKILTAHKINKEKVFEQLEFIFLGNLNFEEIDNLAQQAENVFSLMANEKTMDEMLGSEKFDEMAESFSAEQKTGEQTEKKRVAWQTLRRKKNKSGLLDAFANELTSAEVQKNIDPVIGREKEIERVIQILMRRTKNNPVLLGEAGVGKTAIAEGLAKKIQQGEVPEILANKRIYALDMNGLVAGTVMRGEFEGRLKKILQEIKNDPNIIVFIDELHNIIGAGAINGAMDAANILKPALAKGELRCIGATTFDEYKKHIEDDPALERRFQPVLVAEPSAEEAIKILTGLKENYENHHQIKISAEAIQAAVLLSQRYLSDKFLPDKAIDLIDEAAARLKVKANVINENLRQIKLLEDKIEEINLMKEELVKQENYSQALKLKEKEEDYGRQILALEDRPMIKEKKWLGKVEIKDIANLVSEMTGIPLENLIYSPEAKLINLEKILGQRIIGQQEILKEVAFCLKRSQAGLTPSERPLGSFMFLGPSGVGKTELAKTLAETMFGQRNKKEALIRLDMSEFSEKFNISRLIGSPAGYIGYKEGGRLTEMVRRNPYSVILFDEVEKAHPDVFNILLQILDNGVLTDAAGKKVNFKNTIIILTANLSMKEFDRASLGFGSDGINNRKEEEKFEELKNEIMKNVKEKFQPEFLNRLDKILIFKPLSSKSVEEIIVLQLNELANRLKQREIVLSWSNNLIKYLSKLAYAPVSGARNAQRIIQDKVENELVEKILKQEIKGKDEVKVDWLKNKLRFIIFAEKKKSK